MRRNCGCRGYRPKQAHTIAYRRRQGKSLAKINSGTWTYIEHLLRIDWSPEQISGWMKEFGNHEEIEKGLQCSFYFAHAYSSWERGTNENTNGLIRQYFPKNRDFRTITDGELINAMKRLNNRPRKRLGFKTPNQIFFGKPYTVALNN